MFLIWTSPQDGLLLHWVWLQKNSFWRKGSDIKQKDLSSSRNQIAKKLSLLPELAPWLAPGCRGFTGPVPPPLWIRVITIYSIIKVAILYHGSRQPVKSCRRAWDEAHALRSCLWPEEFTTRYPSASTGNPSRIHLPLLEVHDYFELTLSIPSPEGNAGIFPLSGKSLLCAGLL